MNVSGRHPGTLSEDSAMGGKTNAIIVTLQDQRQAIVSRTDNANTHHCGYALSSQGNSKTHTYEKRQWQSYRISVTAGREREPDIGEQCSLST